MSRKYIPEVILLTISLRSKGCRPLFADLLRSRRAKYAGGVPDLILLRHGQSAWNDLNLFTGWTDVDLTTVGEAEAQAAGSLASEADLDLRVLHTAVLTRAIRTAEIALHAAGRSWLPVRRNWRLNERHYGDLTGKDKKETADQFGLEQVKLWRVPTTFPRRRYPTAIHGAVSVTPVTATCRRSSSRRPSA